MCEERKPKATHIFGIFTGFKKPYIQHEMNVLKNTAM